ncbi:WD40-repeat-containing domain protein [Aspergillus bertholletiae]|uniref:Mitochondrial division protein 1 n=1 Tax=Aspergillus bertholletiae TaxID=1226010 RepID=A0A5N7BLL4_9EURO|nr:WD40-repeat-containing domain protein [Aspergillus bertholletiae]
MELQTFKGHSSWVKSVAFSPDGQTIASGSWDDTIKVWDTKTGVELQTLNGHSNPVTLSNAWVALGGENLIWLPVEYRDFDCYAVKDATLVLGHRNGRVSIVGFHTVG